MSGELRSSLEKSESNVVTLTNALEEKAAELERFCAEEGQRADTRELQYYRSLEAERVKWEAREKRALDEMDRVRAEAGEESSGMESTLSAAQQQHQLLQDTITEKESLVGQLEGQLEEYRSEKEQLRSELQSKVQMLEEQQHLQDVITEKEGLVCQLEGRMEECYSENEQLRVELQTLRAKVQRLEESHRMMEPATTTQPSHGLHVAASTFRLTVHFQLQEEPRSQTLVGTTFLADSSTSSHCYSLAGSGVTLPAETSLVHSNPLTEATMPITTFTTTPTVTPVFASGLTFPPAPVQRETNSTVRTGSMSMSSWSMPTLGHPFTMFPSLNPSVTTTATGTVSAASTDPMVHPNHLPPIPNFHGEDQRDGETFEDWLDHFEAVARIARWDMGFKLVHLISALRGNAKSFYRSCTPTQKNDYSQLVSAFKKRFTPVKLTALQTQMFHSRKQGATESVDDYAQELRKLHSKAYSTAMSGNADAENVGQIVLVNQFVSGLRSTPK